MVALSVTGCTYQFLPVRLIELVEVFEVMALS